MTIGGFKDSGWGAVFQDAFRRSEEADRDWFRDPTPSVSGKPHTVKPKSKMMFWMPLASWWKQ